MRIFRGTNGKICIRDLTDSDFPRFIGVSYFIAALIMVCKSPLRLLTTRSAMRFMSQSKGANIFTWGEIKRLERGKQIKYMGKKRKKVNVGKS